MELKFSKFDNTAWGFRLHGGIDYGTPLTVVKVKGGSLADKAGLQVRDQLLKINDAEVTNVNHEDAHNIILRAGNNFVITIYRPGSKTTTPCFEDLSTESLLSIPKKQLQPLCPSQVAKDNPSQQTPFIVKPTSVTRSVSSVQESFVQKSEFQTIKQLEWKEVAPKLCPKRVLEDNIIGKGTKIDLVEIEKSAVDQAKHIVEVGINKIKANDIEIERAKSVDFPNQKVIVYKRPKSVSFLDDNEETVIEERCRSVTEITQEIEERIRHEKESIQHIEKKNERIWWVGKVKQNELRITEQPTPEEIVEQKMERVCVKDLTKKHEEVTLEQAQSGAIKAAKVLSQQTKSGNLTVPCIVSNVNTTIQTDTLLKTFFIHLTDVMVALNQMIAKDDAGSCQCGPKCQCIQNYLKSQKQTSSETCQQMSELIKKFSSASETINETKTEERKSSIVQKIDVKVETPEKPPDGLKRVPSNEELSSEAKHVIKEVMKETLGVDVTINGKDALEWIADIEQNKIDIEEMKTTEAFSAAETVAKKVVEEIENQIKMEEIPITTVEKKEEKIENTGVVISEVEEKVIVAENEITSEPIVEEPQNVVNEQMSFQTISNITKTQEISSVMTQEISHQEKIEVISSSTSSTTTSEQVIQSAQQSTIVESEVKTQPETNVQSPKDPPPDGQIDPATPTAYVFRLDVKWKGKLAPGSEKTEEPAKVEAEPTIREDLSIVRRPTFYLGDVTIETLTSAQEGAEEKPPIRPTTLDLTSVSTKKEATNLLTNETASASVTTNISETLTNSQSAEMSNSQTAIPVPLSPKALASQHDLATGDAILLASASASLHDTKQQSRESKMTEIKEVAEEIELNKTEVKLEAEKAAEMKSVIEETNKIIEKEIQTTKSVEEAINVSIDNKIENSLYSKIEDFQDTNNNKIETVEEVCAVQAKTKEAAERIYATIETRRTSQTVDHNISQFQIDDSYNLQMNDKPGLTDDEIAGIISGEAEILKDQHVLGLKRVLASHMAREVDEDNDPFSVDFNKMKPQLEFIRHSEVFKALNEDAIKARADLMHEQRKATTFLQKPNRPIPFSRKMVEHQALQNQYKVVIKKQNKKDSEDFGPGILTEGVFLVPELPILVPEPSPVFLEAPEYLPDSEYPDLEDTGIPLPEEPEEPEPEEQWEEETTDGHQEEEDQADLESEEVQLDQVDWISGEMADDLDLPVEDQLAKVQKQLEALAKLPAAIQQTLETVTKQLTKMVPKTDQTQNVKVEETVTNTEETKQEEKTEVQKEIKEEEQKVEQVTTTVIEEKKTEETVIVKEEKHTIKTEEICTLNQEQKINKLRKDVISEMEAEQMSRNVKLCGPHKTPGPKPQFGPLVPQQRPLVLPGGRKWKGPKDAMTDAFIAETLSGQAEIIVGTTLGGYFESAYLPFDDRESNCPFVAMLKEGRLLTIQVNFMKYKKPPVNMDLIKNSPVYKMVHDMEPPSHPIEEREPISYAECDYREKCRSVTPSSMLISSR